jgi:hypothetical protein
VFAVEDRASRFIEIALARDTLPLAPRFTARRAMSAEIAAAEPAPVGTTWGGTKVLVGVDGAPAAPGKDQERRWRAGGLGTRIGPLLTRVT